MTYPLIEQEIVERWLSDSNKPDETDKEFATAMVQAINRAYYKGLEDGRPLHAKNDMHPIQPVQPDA